MESLEGPKTAGVGTQRGTGVGTQRGAGVGTRGALEWAPEGSRSGHPEGHWSGHQRGTVGLHLWVQEGYDECLGVSPGYSVGGSVRSRGRQEGTVVALAWNICLFVTQQLLPPLAAPQLPTL